jgi:uncharacterized membrane protein YdjX (TVP38/TMEM64 family)
MSSTDKPEPGSHLVTRRHALGLAGAIALLALVASSARLHGWLMSVLPVAEAIIRERPVLGVSVFVLFAALSAMLAFVSSAVIVPVGVYVWGKGISVALLLLGWVLGGVVSYGVGRYLGRPAVRMLTSVPLLERYEERLSRNAPFGLVLLFQAAMPSEVPGYLLGLLRYTFWKYLTVLTLTELPYSAATIYLGASFVERRIVVLIAVGTAMIVFSVWALHTLHRRIQEYRG